VSSGEGERSKKIDEDWKNVVLQEKEKLEKAEGGGTLPPQPDFNFFISSLAMETLIALGEMEHPATKDKTTNLPQAQYLIDTVDMLKQKSKGNLSAEETKFLDTILSDLKMRYVSKLKQG